MGIDTYQLKKQGLKIQHVLTGEEVIFSARVLRRLEKRRAQLREKAPKEGTNNKVLVSESVEADQLTMALHDCRFENRQSRERARCLGLYRGFLVKRPYREIEAETRTSTKRPDQLFYEVMSERLSWAEFVEVMEWLLQEYKPSEARAEKMARAEKKAVAHYETRKANSQKNHQNCLEVKKQQEEDKRSAFAELAA